MQSITTDQRPDDEGSARAIDAHVGAQIVLRRTLLGMSQERLSDVAGLTFQQVRKYELGVDRVGASHLFDISQALDVPISFFFCGMPDGMDTAPIFGTRGRINGLLAAGEPLSPGDENLTKRETLELVRTYYRISNPALRKQVVDLMKGLGSAGVSKKD